MIDRRRFVQSGLALPVIPLFASATLPSIVGAVEASVLQLERFVFDVRFAAPFNIAQHMAGFGVEIASFADDLMRLWYEELDLHWREAPMALAGVTMAEALFALETLAMDRRMRVVYRGEHSAAENGRISHRLTGPVEMLAAFSSIAENADWEADLARAMTQCPLGKPQMGEAQFVTEERSLSLRLVPLVSWIIAPRSAVSVTLQR